jgi:hypothetical protein
MMAILRPDANDLPQWNLYDENCLVRHYSVELSHQSLLEAIWTDFGDDIAVSIAYGK